MKASCVWAASKFGSALYFALRQSRRQAFLADVEKPSEYCGFQKKRAESYYKSIQEEMRATDLKA
jgi:hypothetical protein